MLSPKEFKVTKLNEDWLVIQMYGASERRKITRMTMELDHKTGVQTVTGCEELTVEGAKPLLKDYYIFTNKQLDTMLHNFELGNCPVTQKGLIRYCEAYGCDLSWTKMPKRTAIRMALSGVPLIKELLGLYSYISKEGAA